MPAHTPCTRPSTPALPQAVPRIDLDRQLSRDGQVLSNIALVSVFSSTAVAAAIAIATSIICRLSIARINNTSVQSSITVAADMTSINIISS